MGAAAFLIAEFLEISYAAVVLAALVPALLYYLLLFIQVDLTAAKEGLAGLPASKLPRLGEVMRGGWVFLAPLVVLIYALFWMNFPAGKAGMTAVGATVLVTVFRKATRPNLTKVIEILAGTGRALLEIGVITGIAGVIIGVLNLSGLGFSVSLALVQIGEHSLLLLLLLAALMSIILGMGMPTVSVYILLAVLVAPSLEKLGLSPIAAHLFILYFGLLSMITPPVAIASFAAAAISGGDPLRTGWESVKLGAMAYVVPFIFIFSQELLLQGTFLGIVWAVGTTALGAFFLAVALSGYLFSSLSPLVRLAYFASAIALFFNFGFNDGMGGWLNVAGLLVGLSMLAANRTRRSEAAKRDAPTG
jgi:TRAP transporter 4TM/12TM fusion protein